MAFVTRARGAAVPSLAARGAVVGKSAPLLQTVTTTANSGVTYTTSYAYGATPVAVTYPDGTAESGLATTITNPPDASGGPGTVTQVYDSYGSLISSTDPLNHTTLNEYDANHNLIAVTDPLGHIPERRTP